MRKSTFLTLASVILAVGSLTVVVAQRRLYVSEVHASELSASMLEQNTSPDAGFTSQGVADPSAQAVGPSPKPLRWRVRYAAVKNYSTVLDCSTYVIVRNLASSATSVDVDWIYDTGVSAVMGTQSIPAGGVRQFGIRNSNDTTNYFPFQVINVNISSDFQGSAQVHADDPRISAAAFFRCDDTNPPDQSPNTINSIPADPVGTTLEYFQAGMPIDWSPRLAEPEAPESSH